MRYLPLECALRFFALQNVSFMVFSKLMPGAIQYKEPTSWIKYDRGTIEDSLLAAKASIMALRAIPFQRRWVRDLQEIQLKMEVAGTSQIEGADFAANELDTAIQSETPEQLLTRSQKQANAAVRTYRQIAEIADDRPVSTVLIKFVHASIVSGCDDDHCPPGVIRRADENVTFGAPKHRGVTGGKDCANAFDRLAEELATTFRDHDPLIQALALHYHFAAMHPFLDGNGRTARALEALMLQRAGLKDVLFIAMSNYYYEEKRAYLAALSEVRARAHDLTPFLRFALNGIASQVVRLTSMLKNAVAKELFRNLMNELFVRLESTRKRVIVKRQLMVLNRLLERDGEIEWLDLVDEVREYYAGRKNVGAAMVRDVNRLGALGAVRIRLEETEGRKPRYLLQANLDWPSTITDSEFFEKIERLPKSKTHRFLAATG